MKFTQFLTESKMKSFKYYILESSKLPAIQTVFGTKTFSKKEKEDLEDSKETKVYFEPTLTTSHIKEELNDINHLIKPHSDEEIKKFHKDSRLKDEKLPSHVALEHPGWLHVYSMGEAGHSIPNVALWHHHNKTEISDDRDKSDHERAKTYSHEVTKVIAKHKTPYDFTVFSGLSPQHAERLKNRNSPSSFHHPAFLSTSTDYEQAVKYTGPAKSKEEKHVLRLHIPKGTQAGSIRHISQYRKENEILLNRGHDLEIHHEPTIINHPKEGKIHIWNAKVIGHNPQKLNQKPLSDVLPNDVKPTTNQK